MSKEIEKPCHKDDPCAAERHSEFYFSDGTVVLSAEYSATAKPIDDKSREKTSDRTSDTSTSLPLDPTKRKTLFRVHKSLLVSASQVFANMFELSNGTEAESEMHDGVPLIHMPDPAEDIEVMIDTLYGSSFTRLMIKRGRVHEELPLLMSRYLEMATKYDIPSLKADVTDMIEQEWPSTLKSWDGQDRYRRTLNMSPPEPASLVALAHRYNLPYVRAIALYELCQAEPNQDWNVEEWTIRRYGRGATWELLTREDYRDILRIKSLQRSLQIHHLGDHCENGKERFQELMVDLLNKGDYLRLLRQYKEELQAGRCCGYCKGTLLKRVDRCREKLWSDIQSIVKGTFLGASEEYYPSSDEDELESDC